MAELQYYGTFPASSFLRQTIKVNEVNTKYFFLHIKQIDATHNHTTTGCYKCIVDAAAKYSVDEILTGRVLSHGTGREGTQLVNDGADPVDADALRRVKTSYLRGLARSRYDLYRSNFDLTYVDD